MAGIRVRARTLDMLGRQQIAGVQTALPNWTLEMIEYWLEFSCIGWLQTPASRRVSDAPGPSITLRCATGLPGERAS